MTTRSFLTPLVGGLMLLTPIAAQAADRAPSPVAQAEGVEGDNTWIWVGLGLVALAVLIIVIADDNNHNHPVSP